MTHKEILLSTLKLRKTTKMLHICGNTNKLQDLIPQTGTDLYSMDHKVGNNFIAATMDMSLVDTVIKVSDCDAFEIVKLLAKKEGIIAGSSSGAALFAALSIAEHINGGNIVIIFPDRGERYFSRNLFI